jgi:hypothetical protein
MPALTDAMGIAGAACFISNKTARRVDWAFFSGLSAETESRFAEHYALIDPFTPLLQEAHGWMELSQCYSRSILRRSEWYNDFVVDCGVGDILGTRLLDTPTRSVFFGFHQQLGRSFTDDNHSILNHLTKPLTLAALWHVRRLYGLEREGTDASAPDSGTRYYFHLSNGRQYRDNTGTVFTTREEAVAHASLIASELAGDEDWNDFVITGTDENGLPVLRIPIHM